MIRIQQLKVKVDIISVGDAPISGKISEQERKQIEKSIRHELRLNPSIELHYDVVRKAIDARKKDEICYTYTIDIELLNEEMVLKRSHSKKSGIQKAAPKYEIPKLKSVMNDRQRPLIIGSGPAGLFCAYAMAKAGLRPIIWERGESMETRCQDVDAFWQNQTFKPYSNVQFGEGGAGTFSDGKLNTLVKDVTGRNHMVLQVFIEHGAPEEIAYLTKPHIGTDRLREVIPAIRNSIVQMGGEFHFRTCMTELLIDDNAAIVGCKGQVEEEEEIVFHTKHIVLATGHSARDTFQTLHLQGVKMEPKAFAMGVRVQHPQSQINEAQYKEMADKLPPADYKLTANVGERGVYTFCMCPGGVVVNASSEEQMLAINGMSNYNRAQTTANSAVIVTVTPDDFNEECKECCVELRGMEFQRKWERAAFRIGDGCIPAQNFDDFEEGRVTTQWRQEPNTKGTVTMADLHQCLPSYVSRSIGEGMHVFGKKIHGFDHPDTILLGVETRTSSPIRMLRDEKLQSNYRGLYPCGEGAGYAGGIMSAAMDGLKVAEAVIQEYQLQK